MTISELKPMEEILGFLEGEGRVFLIGCSDCATVCQVGGEDQLKEMAEALRGQGKQVTGYLVAEPGCHQLGLKKSLREHKAEVEAADALVVMSCGTGAQTAQVVADKPVHSATNTLFLGSVQRFGVFTEFCSACGDCTLERTGNICSYTRCAKNLQNGPCGGTTAEGKCEVDPETDCAWKLIYDELKLRGRLELVRPYIPPKSHRLPNAGPGRHTIAREKEAA